jgi:hypothetical protein
LKQVEIKVASQLPNPFNASSIV